MPMVAFKVGANGDLRTLPRDTPESGTLGRYGPWPHQPFYSPGGGEPMDFYGHPGETADLSYTDGHAGSIRDVDPKDWNIH